MKNEPLLFKHSLSWFCMNFKTVPKQPINPIKTSSVIMTRITFKLSNKVLMISNAYGWNRTENTTTAGRSILSSIPSTDPAGQPKPSLPNTRPNSVKFNGQFAFAVRHVVFAGHQESDSRFTIHPTRFHRHKIRLNSEQIAYASGNDRCRFNESVTHIRIIQQVQSSTFNLVGARFHRASTHHYFKVHACLLIK